MSYIRFGEEGSDVYVIETAAFKYECVGCTLDKNAHTDDLQKFLLHLAAHVSLEHNIPDTLIQRLKEEENELNDELKGDG